MTTLMLPGKKRSLLHRTDPRLHGLGLAGCETANSLTSLFSSSNEAPTASVAPPPLATSKGAQYRRRSGHRSARERLGRAAQSVDCRHGAARPSRRRRPTRKRSTHCAATSCRRWRRRRASKGVLHLGRDGCRRQGRSPRQRRRAVPSGKSKDPWTAVTPALVQSIAGKTAPVGLDGLAAMPGAGATPAVASAGRPAAWCKRRQSDARRLAASGSTEVDRHRHHAARAPIKALVPTVTGAPGDGELVRVGAAA